MPYKKVEDLRSQAIVGTKQSIRAMEKGNVSEVFIAEDVDQHIKTKVIDLANRLNVKYEIVDSKEKLGAACGIKVGAATVAIKKE